MSTPEVTIQNVPETIPVSRERAKKIGRPPMVVLIHEAWGRKEGFRDVQRHLRDAGVPSMAVDLPIENPFKTFNDYARVVTREMKLGNVTKAVLFGASLGGDTVAWIPQTAPGIDYKGMIFSGAPLQNVTVSSFPAEKLALNEGVERNTDDFKKGRRPYKTFNQFFGIHEPDYGFSYFDERWAVPVFYNRCAPEVQVSAPSQLRMQWRSKNEPRLERFPIEIPTLCLRGRYDNAVTEQWCRHRAESLLETELVITDTDHTPQRSDPEGLTKNILTMIH